MKFFTIGPVVSEEKSFEIVDGRRTTKHAYTISYPGAFGAGELKVISDTLKDREGKVNLGEKVRVVG